MMDKETRGFTEFNNFESYLKPKKRITSKLGTDIF